MRYFITEQIVWTESQMKLAGRRVNWRNQATTITMPSTGAATDSGYAGSFRVARPLQNPRVGAPGSWVERYLLEISSCHKVTQRLGPPVFVKSVLINDGTTGVYAQNRLVMSATGIWTKPLARRTLPRARESAVRRG
jgi:hypothetical protein